MALLAAMLVFLAGHQASGLREEAVDGAPAALQGIFEEPGRLDASFSMESGADSFLLDLDRRPTRTDGAPALTAVWRVDGTLEQAGASVLRAYRDAAGYELMTSGYLDLFGDEWGALVRHGEGADIVLVRSTGEGGSDSRVVVSVTRVFGERGDEGE